MINKNYDANWCGTSVKMRISLDSQSKKPRFGQIEEFLREQMLAGTLLPETRLPATREKAHSPGVNRITV
jgi:DNA-binding transcriptional regulator YhcF (GntR family)